MKSAIKLTAYSHGAGCGCKISPEILTRIIGEVKHTQSFPQLLVGNTTRDDAAVFDLGNGQALISTTDFFMPIVDDAYDFGRIAAANAISDVYAMGGKPLLAIAVLGWPIQKLPAEVAAEVLKGALAICEQAGIPLSGGHSIDCPEPLFGLAVTGIVPTEQVKKNSQAQPGDRLYLTKPLGIGIITTAQKKGLARESDLQMAVDCMTTLNKIGQTLGTLDYVHALTDVTGFGLLGHLHEMCTGSELSAQLYLKAIPVLSSVEKYIQQNAIPGGTERNWNSYGKDVEVCSEEARLLLADPQTSGGLLVAVNPEYTTQFEDKLIQEQVPMFPIGSLTSKGEKIIQVLNAEL